MQGVPTYSASACRYEPAQWLARGRAANPGVYDWSRWPGLIAQWDKASNAGVDISQVPQSLTTVAWFWRCAHGHRWREPISSRLSGWPSNPPDWKTLVRSWAACRQCVLLRYGMLYTGCGHPSDDLSTLASPRIEDAGACPRCRGKRRLPAPGTPIRTNYDPPTSKEEGRLRKMLARRIPLIDPLVANAIVVPRTSWGARWFYPDMMVPGSRVVIEYDSPGPSGRAHGGQSHDRERDRLLRQFGWEVIRVRVGGLPALGPHDIVGARLSVALADAAAGEYRRIMMRKARSNGGRQRPAAHSASSRLPPRPSR